MGYGHRADTLREAARIGAVDETHDEPAAAVRGADLVVVCTPVGMIPKLLAAVARELAPGAVVTDVGSTKRSIVAAAEQALPPGAHFVGSHPMAGSEKRGVQFARADLFERAVCITTQTARTNEAALAKAEAFWQLLGMRTTRLTPDEHDRLLADVSHLPHVIAAALVGMQADAALGLCGKGFLDVTRIAAGDAGLWRDILLDNRDNLRRSIARMGEEMKRLEALLESRDAHALEAWLARAAARRETIIERKENGE